MLKQLFKNPDLLVENNEYEMNEGQQKCHTKYCQQTAETTNNIVYIYTGTVHMYVHTVVYNV